MSAVMSDTYDFGTSQSLILIEEAFERIGILPDLVTAQQINTCQRTINLLLSEWINRGLNLWTVKQSMLNLIYNQNAYLLPTATSDILEATVRTSNRNLGGTAFTSAGGVAANAFDNNSQTACIQTAPNGYISYNYGNNVNYAIAMVGVQSNVTRTYTLVAEYSMDNITWNTSIIIPEQEYLAGNNIWFVVNVPTLAQYYRIRETGGAILNVQELYFNTTLNDTVITRISRSEYISYPTKNSTGRPTSFYVDRQINPIVYIWPTPIAPYNNMFYTRVSMMQDIGQMINLADIPQRFYEALCACTASKLALKYAPERYSILKMAADESFNLAAKEDSERVPLRIFGDYSSGWGSE